MGFHSVGKNMGLFNLEPNVTPTQTSIGCKRAHVAAIGKPDGWYVMSCDCLQLIAATVLPELRDAVDKWA